MTWFDEREAFLNEVIQTPDDDAPRLIYADWLQETGDPRGEFIRAQCELEHADRFSPAFYDLSDCCRRLLAEHRREWTEELEQDVDKAVFRRGFVENITIRGRRFAQQAGPLFERTPLQWVRINYLRGVGQRVAACRELERIRYLDVSDLTTPAADVTALLLSPYARGLRGVNLARQRFPLDRELARALRNMQQLRRLDVTGSQILPGFWDAYARDLDPPCLEELALGNEYGPASLDGAAALRPPNLACLKVRGQLRVRDVQQLLGLPWNRLREIHLAGTGLPAASLAAIADQGGLDLVERLDLRGCDLGPQSLRTLVGGQRLSHCKQLLLGEPPHRMRTAHGTASQVVAEEAAVERLEWLHLGPIGDSDLTALGRSPRLAGLKVLRAECQGPLETSGEALANASFCDALRMLGLPGAAFGRSFARAVGGGLFPQVTCLDLSSTFQGDASVSEEDLKTLLLTGAFPQLRELHLDNLLLSSSLLATLAAWAPFPELRELNFNGNYATNDAAAAVLTSDRLPKLARLSVANCSGMRNRPALKRRFGERIRV